MANIKISQLPAKGANLGANDLVEVAEFTGTGYVSKSITGQEIINAASGGGTAWGDITGTLADQTDLQTALDAKQDDLISGTNIKTIEGQSVLGSGNIDITKSDVGLSNVDNTSDLNKPISTATQTALNAKQNTLVSGSNIKTIEGQSILGAGNIDLTKADVGLSNVDNTSDVNKPISTATQTALNAKQDTLVSGSNIKTINFNSILGSGDISVVSTLNGTSPINASVGAGGSGNISINQATTSTNGFLSSTDWNTFNNKQAALVSGTNIKTINGNSVLGSGNLTISGGPRKYVNTTLQTAIDIFSETIIGSYLIPANTFSANGSFEFLIKQGASVSTGASVQSKIYINSSNTLTGATLLATSTNNSGSAYYNFVRNAFISSSNIYILGTSLGSNTDFLTSSFAQSVVPFDVTAARYFIVTMSCSLPTSVEIRGVKFIQNDI